MRVALCCDLLDGELCGMQIALGEFLNCVRQSNYVSKFELIHTKPFSNGAYSAFADVVVKRGRYTGSGHYWSQVAVPRKVRKMQVDLLWWPYQIMPPINCVVPRVISVWDLAPMTFRDANWSRLAVAIKYKWILVRALKSAAHIICHSKAVADEIMRRFDLSASRISVVYPGLGELFRNALENPEPVNKDGYILYVGTCTARKNVNLLIEAYKLLTDQGVKNQLALLVNGPEKCKAEMFRY
ncbi:MAG: glycosyltransferase, partial [Anaerolineae bacterium]|nr:glycosyltransferase [Anaerolineae bacterium]